MSRAAVQGYLRCNNMPLRHWRPLKLCAITLLSSTYTKVTGVGRPLHWMATCKVWRELEQLRFKFRGVAVRARDDCTSLIAGSPQELTRAMHMMIQTLTASGLAQSACTRKGKQLVACNRRKCLQQHAPAARLTQEPAAQAGAQCCALVRRRQLLSYGGAVLASTFISLAPPAHAAGTDAKAAAEVGGAASNTEGQRSRICKFTTSSLDPQVQHFGHSKRWLGAGRSGRSAKIR